MFPLPLHFMIFVLLMSLFIVYLFQLDNVYSSSLLPILLLYSKY